jgi:hypothetical protein
MFDDGASGNTMGKQTDDVPSSDELGEETAETTGGAGEMEPEARAAAEPSEEPPAKAQGTLSAESYEAEDVFENAEPWSPIETKIVLGSFAVAIVLLIVFGYLINTFILS